MAKSTNTLTAIGFSTSFLNKLKDIKEIHIDVTYKTAKERFELYGIIGEKYGTGFALGYLILDVVGELESTKTINLTEFLSKFKELELKPEYIFTDKNFAEINASRFVWPNADIQLCLWHVKKAILTKMRSSKKQERYNTFTAVDMELFPFIDTNFIPHNGHNGIICLAKEQKVVLALIERHFNMHPLILTDKNRLFLNPDEIWKLSVREIYQYCIEHNNPCLWNYLYFSWYSKDRWNLWARSCKQSIPYAKTNMLIEAHWKVVKHDYLYIDLTVQDWIM